MEDQSSAEGPPSPERQSFLKLTRELASLPIDQSTAAIETGASIASVSLRAAIEFLRACHAAAEVLEASELRAWAEFGRRLAMSDVETAISFFNEGVEGFRELPERLHPIAFQLIARQVTLSTSIALSTFQSLPELAKLTGDTDSLALILEVAAEVSRRSAKHSAELLNKTPEVINALNRFNDPQVAARGIELAAEFAFRAGGIATDAWVALPAALARLSDADALRLLKSSIDFLERGGGASLQVLVTGGEILRALPEVFEEWLRLLWVVSRHGNASVVAFIRSSPRFVQAVSADANRSRSVDIGVRVLKLTSTIAEVDGEAALACFRSSALALRSVSIAQFEEWALRGLELHGKDARGRRSYFALETRGSNDALRTGSDGLALETVKHLLQLYVEALTGHEVEISALASVPVESRISDGRTIHLPSMVAEFGDDDLDFRLYKVLAAHAAGQIEFGTHEQGTPELHAAHSTISETYDVANADARDAFSIADELLMGQTPTSVTSSTNPGSEDRTDKNVCPTDVDYRQVLGLFPEPHLGRRIFGTLENCRIDLQLRKKYRGLVRDLDLVREHLRRTRPSVLEMPASLLPFELLFQATLLGGPTEDARTYYAQIVSEMETVVAEHLSHTGATVADSLIATSRVYSLFKSITPDDSVQEMETKEDRAPDENENAPSSDSVHRPRSEQMPQRKDARELFNAWNDPNAGGDPDELEGGEAWTDAELPEQVLEEGEVAYNYDEWDRELTDHRMSWCRVVEKRVKQGDRAFV
ncbi:MAG TPA: hypothetical protein VIT88_10775, partial [Pyrinomonadaceae bacterium]